MSLIENYKNSLAEHDNYKASLFLLSQNSNTEWTAVFIRLV